MKKAGLFAAGVTTLPIINSGCSNTTQQPVEKEIGVQLWSVRDLLEADFEGTINQVGQAGFDFVEAYGLNPTGIFPGTVTANEYERIVKFAGMRIASCHSSYFQAEDTPNILEAAKRLGTDWVVIAWLSEAERGDYYAIAENLNAIGEQFKGSGIGFGYHNHDFEFWETEEGEIPMEILLENTDPENVSFQADLYWVKKAGLDPLTFIQKYPGRFCSYHVKDADADLNQVGVGEGIIDFAAIFAENKTAGVEYLFVEDERTQDPLEQIKSGYNHLKNLDY